jgi:hypothetical protein
VFQLLGVLPGGDTVSTAGGINESGDIAGASRNGSSFLVPPSAFLAKPGQPLMEVFDFGTGTYLNDVGQVVGYSANNHAFRYTPGPGVELLGPLGSHDLGFAWSINTAGDVVGEAVASLSVHYEPLPFLYTDEGGMQEIGDFGGYAVAVSINDAREVTGNYFEPSLPHTYPWVWSAEKGVRFLKDLVSPTEHLNLLEAARINASGQILCQATDSITGDHVVVILTPPGAQGWTNLGFALDGTTGQPLLTGQGDLVAGTPVTLSLSGALAGTPLGLVIGADPLYLPFKDGLLVPAFAAPLGLVVPLVTDASGGAGVTATWPAGVPSGLTFYAQAWLLDAGASEGFASSNAVAATAP